MTVSENEVVSVNFPDVRNVQIAAQSLQLLIANVSRESETEILGQGHLSVYAEHIHQERLRKDKAKREEHRAFEKLAELLLDRLSALQEELVVSSGQVILATSLWPSQYFFSDSFGVNPPLCRCGLTRL